MNKIKEKIFVVYLINNFVLCLLIKNKKYFIIEFLQSKYKKVGYEGKEMILCNEVISFVRSINKN